MKKILIKTCGLIAATLLMHSTFAQTQTQAPADTTTEFKPSGKLWGYAFGDYAFKGASDDLNRGRSNQYTGVPVNANIFQWRRIYLGYDYNISPKFSAEFLLAAEDDFAAGIEGQSPASVTVSTVTGTGTPTLGSNGDVLLNNKFSPYVKLADLRWKNIFKNSDLVVGQSPTPTFARNGSGMASEEVWGYRSIERTITDIRRTGSFDLGVALQGKFTSNGNYGYTVMVGNGQGAKPENDNSKWFYGDVWGKFANKKIVVDLYQDYQKSQWGVAVKGNNGPQYRDRNMTKLFVAYVTKPITVGVEAFMNTLLGDAQVTGKDGFTYYRTTKATGVSVFVRGQIIADKLNYFARFDNYDPSGNLKNIADDAALSPTKITGLTAQYDPAYKEMFATFGIDYTPFKNVHIMPNIWMNTYESSLDYQKYSGLGMVPNKGTDAVYRLTFYYVYGK